jgi:arylformamidase
MPVYPGTEPPSMDRANTLERDGFLEHRLCMHTHTGTHMDAPAHILPGGATLDSYPADRFMGPAFMIEALDGPPGIASLRAHEDEIRKSDFLIMRTGWGEKWGSDGYFSGFPVLDVAAADWLCGMELKGFGVDAVSVDPVGDSSLPVHHVLLESGILIIENLANLSMLASPRLVFACLPLHISGADGAPARAVAIV